MATTTTSSSSIPMWTTRSRLVTWPIAWTIDNMSHRYESISSPSFKYEKNQSVVLNLDTRDNHLPFTVRSTSTAKTQYSVKLYIVTAGGEKKRLYESPLNVDLNWKSYSSSYLSALTIDKFISRAALNNSANGYLHDDQLTIIAEFAFLVNVTNIEGTFGERLKQMKSLTVDSATRKAYGQLLTTGKLSDVTLIVEGKVIHAHKAILAIRSPVLAAMFEGDTKEAQESRVEITDVKVDVFEQMLAYIYTGEVPSLNDQQTAEELLIAADKYQVDSLKAICESYLCSQLSPETAPNLFLFAEAINASMLKESAVKLINNRATDVFKAMASDSDQLLEMIRLLAVKNQEKDAAANK